MDLSLPVYQDLFPEILKFFSFGEVAKLRLVCPFFRDIIRDGFLFDNTKEKVVVSLFDDVSDFNESNLFKNFLFSSFNFKFVWNSPNGHRPIKHILSSEYKKGTYDALNKLFMRSIYRQMYVRELKLSCEFFDFRYKNFMKLKSLKLLRKLQVTYTTYGRNYNGNNQWLKEIKNLNLKEIIFKDFDSTVKNFEEFLSEMKFESYEKVGFKSHYRIVKNCRFLKEIQCKSLFFKVDGFLYRNNDPFAYKNTRDKEAIHNILQNLNENKHVKKLEIKCPQFDRSSFGCLNTNVVLEEIYLTTQIITESSIKSLVKCIRNNPRYVYHFKECSFNTKTIPYFIQLMRYSKEKDARVRIQIQSLDFATEHDEDVQFKNVSKFIKALHEYGRNIEKDRWYNVNPLYLDKKECMEEIEKLKKVDERKRNSGTKNETE